MEGNEKYFKSKYIYFSGLLMSRLTCVCIWTNNTFYIFNIPNKVTGTVNSSFVSLPNRFLTLGNISHKKTNSIREVRNEMDNNSMLSI